MYGKGIAYLILFVAGACSVLLSTAEMGGGTVFAVLGLLAIVFSQVILVIAIDEEMG